MKGMTRKNVVGFILSVVFIFSITACAVRTQVEQVSIDQVRQTLKYQNIVFRNFTANPDVKAPEGPLMECRTSAINYLELKNLFKAVEKDSGKSYDEPTLYVDVNVTSLRIVGGAARFWAGAFAGRSNMNIAVKLIDADGNLVVEKELKGAPNAMASAWSFSSADHSLPQKMGFLLGDFIIAHVSGT
jgi:hypothetical protein